MCVLLCKVCFLFEIFCVKRSYRWVFVVGFFFLSHMCNILRYISIWNFYIKSQLCGVSNQWEEISGNILGITDYFWSELYVYTTKDYSANTIFVYMYIKCQLFGQLEFIYCVDVSMVCPKYCIPCIYGFNYWTLCIFFNIWVYLISYCLCNSKVFLLCVTKDYLWFSGSSVCFANVII